MSSLPAPIRSSALQADDETLAGTPIVVVLGMHRSGTSLCSHILSLLDIDMADDVGANTGNEGGHWERWEIMQFQDRILEILDRGYYTYSHDFALPSGWWALPEVRKVRLEIEEYLRGRMRPGEVFGFKDPRTARLFPMWNVIFRKLKLRPIIIFCVRSPSQVARSLQSRDGLPSDIGEYRWLVYNVECSRQFDAHACVIDYEQWFTDPKDTLRRLLLCLRDVITVDAQTVGMAVEQTINANYRHSEDKAPAARHPLVRYFYDLVRQTDRDERTRAHVERFVEQFLAFQQILPFETVVRSLNRSLSDRASELDAAKAAFQDASNRLTALEASANVQAQRIAELESTSAVLAHDAARSCDECLRTQEIAVAERDQALRLRDLAISQRDKASSLAENAARQAATLADDLAKARQERQDIEERYVRLAHWSDAYHKSTLASLSWRVTKPMRQLGVGRPVRPKKPDFLDH